MGTERTGCSLEFLPWGWRGGVSREARCLLQTDAFGSREPLSRLPPLAPHRWDSRAGRSWGRATDTALCSCPQHLLPEVPVTSKAVITPPCTQTLPERNGICSDSGLRTAHLQGGAGCRARPADRTPTHPTPPGRAPRIRPQKWSGRKRAAEPTMGRRSLLSCVKTLPEKTPDALLPRNPRSWGRA